MKVLRLLVFAILVFLLVRGIVIHIDVKNIEKNHVTKEAWIENAIVELKGMTYNTDIGLSKYGKDRMMDEIGMMKLNNGEIVKWKHHSAHWEENTARPYWILPYVFTLEVQVKESSVGDSQVYIFGVNDVVVGRNHVCGSIPLIVSGDNDTDFPGVNDKTAFLKLVGAP